MKKCSACIATFGPDNAQPGTVKVKSFLIPGKVRELCEDHAMTIYVRFGADMIIDWPDWKTTRVNYGGNPT